MKVKENILMVVFILLLGSFWTTALVFVDNVTKPIIDKNQNEKLRKSVLTALNIPYEDKEVDEVFKNNIETIEKNDKKVYRDKKTQDIAFSISGSGSQGPIIGVLALKSDLKTIKGITIVSQVETPGLGDRVLAESNLENFKGKYIVPQIKIVAAGSAQDNNEVDGITGATLTCKAFQQILNTVSKEYISLISVDGK